MILGIRTNQAIEICILERLLGETLPMVEMLCTLVLS